MEELVEENKRLNYRIKHLVKGMIEIQENKVCFPTFFSDLAKTLNIIRKMKS